MITSRTCIRRETRAARDLSCKVCFTPAIVAGTMKATKKLPSHCRIYYLLKVDDVPGQANDDVPGKAGKWAVDLAFGAELVDQCFAEDKDVCPAA